MQNVVNVAYPMLVVYKTPKASLCTKFCFPMDEMLTFIEKCYMENNDHLTEFVYSESWGKCMKFPMMALLKAFLCKKTKWMSGIFILIHQYKMQPLHSLQRYTQLYSGLYYYLRIGSNVGFFATHFKLVAQHYLTQLAPRYSVWGNTSNLALIQVCTVRDWQVADLSLSHSCWIL